MATHTFNKDLYVSQEDLEFALAIIERACDEDIEDPLNEAAELIHNAIMVMENRGGDSDYGIMSRQHRQTAGDVL